MVSKATLTWVSTWSDQLALLNPLCRLTLVDAKGKPVTHRWIGTNIGVGCCGPAQLTLAVREPGSYTLQLRLGDGSVRKQALTIDEKTPRIQTLTIR